MLGIFRTNQFAVNFLLLIYVFLVRSAAFIFPGSRLPTDPGPLSEWVYHFIGPEGLWPIVLAALLVFIQAFMLNELVAKFRLANEVTFFPGVFYALLASYIPEFHYLSPPLMANTFFILAFFDLFGTYKKLSVAARLFNLGLWLSVASLFSFSYIVLILFALIGVSVLRSFRIKERVMILIGGIVPFYLAGVYYFWMDNLAGFFQYFTGRVGMISFSSEHAWGVYLKLGFIGILLLVAIASFGLYRQRKNMQVQKYLTIIFWSMLIAGLSLFFREMAPMEQLLILTPPLSVLISFNFLSIGSKQLAELLHLLLFFIVLVFQFLPVLNL